MHSHLSIPFLSSSHVWDEFEVDGVLHLGTESVRIEYEGEWTKYDDDGKPQKKVTWEATRLEVPFGEIASIRLGRTWLGRPQLLLLARSIGALGSFPLAKGVQCVIPLPRKHRKEAQHLVAEVEAAIADAEIRRLES